MTNTNFFLPQITILAYDGRSVGRVYLAVGLRLAVPLTLSKVVAIFKRKQYVENLFFFFKRLLVFFSLFLPLISTSTYNVIELTATILSLRSDDRVDGFPVQYFL